MDCDLDFVAEKFQTLLQKGVSEAVEYVTNDDVITNTVSNTLKLQVASEKFSSGLFEWLYVCAQLKPKSPEMFRFCLQFVPDLILLYLTSLYEENLDKLKANAEALLTTLMIEVPEAGKGSHNEQVPSLSKPSVYHQVKSTASVPLSVLSQPLTEAVLQLHNELDSVPKRPSFSHTSISLNNRSQFLAGVVHLFSDHLSFFSSDIKTTFCQFCIRVSLQGMRNLRPDSEGMIGELPSGCGDILNLKRFSISDDFVSSLLRGTRMCLFQSCHRVARHALQALALRSEYELLTNSIQVSHTMLRLAADVKPEELELHTHKFASYHGPGSPDFSAANPGEVHRSLNSYLLHHNLSTSTSQPDTPTSSGSGHTSLSSLTKSTAV